MLLELRVSQFAIIDQVQIEFKKGLNVLSGETGSGKSVLLKSLGLLMGDKASNDVVRTGASQATVEGLFDIRGRPDIQKKLSALGIETEEQKLLVRRVISTEDKSKVYINGSLSTLAQLRELISPLIEVTGTSPQKGDVTSAAPLIEMTGQHDNRNLTSKAYHLDMLDRSSGAWDKRTLVEKKFKAMSALIEQIRLLSQSQSDRLQKLDYLKFQLSELSQLELDLAQDAGLEDEIRRLRSSSKIMQFTDLCDQVIYHDDDSVSSRLKTLIKKSNEFASLDSELVAKLEPLSQAMNLIDDAIYATHSYVKNLKLDPSLLDEKESRLSQIRKLQKKHGTDLEGLVELTEKLKTEIASLENSDVQIDHLKKELSLAELEFKKLAEDLHSARQKAATALAKKMNTELKDLNMNGVVFDIEVRKLTVANEHGVSDCEFMTQTSPRDGFKPIAKVASGGELSRILLALKKSSFATAGSSFDLPRTYLFDEVDTGVSGPTAEKVGRKLREIAHDQQVICVTHLPQVAACGHVHYNIEKQSQKGQTNMVVNELSTKERIKEIARLISGEKISKTSLDHAEQLLQSSHGA